MTKTVKLPNDLILIFSYENGKIKSIVRRYDSYDAHPWSGRASDEDTVSDVSIDIEEAISLVTSARADDLSFRMRAKAAKPGEVWPDADEAWKAVSAQYRRSNAYYMLERRIERELERKAKRADRLQELTGSIPTVEKYFGRLGYLVHATTKLDISLATMEVSLTKSGITFRDKFYHRESEDAIMCSIMHIDRQADKFFREKLAESAQYISLIDNGIVCAIKDTQYKKTNYFALKNGVVAVPGWAMRHLIGRGGSMIREAQQRFGRIKLLEDQASTLEEPRRFKAVWLIDADTFNSL